MRTLAFATVLSAAVSSAAVPSAAAPAFERTEVREACSEYTPLRRPLFGDLHVHTRYSLDASTQGTRTTPQQAYAFARGARIGIQPWSDANTPGRYIQLRRPLDFSAVTDHSELFGETRICNTPGTPGHDSLMCRIYRGWPRLAFFLMNSRRTPFGFCRHSRGTGDDRNDGKNGGDQAQRNEFAGCSDADVLTWSDIRAAAEAAYDRTSACTFTTFVGYEWTGYTHRNVIFRNAEVPSIAPSSAEFPHETKLWDELDRQCRDRLASCDFVVIPHNSNVSNGTTFQTVRPDGRAFTAADANRRVHNEPLVEIMQHKGSSECYLGAGTQDELCGFENVPYDDLSARFVTWLRKPPAAINFTRTALGIGLLQRQRIGANPFEFGTIGSTDTHLGAPGLTYERNYPGHGGAGVAIGKSLPDMLLDPIEYNPGGLAVVWAEENSRDSIFAALRRREAYATSGPRIVFRLFAAWELPQDLCQRNDFAEVGYARGVPMGGVLSHPAHAAGTPPTRPAPVLAIRALKDPGTEAVPGRELQRLQIVKLWVEAGAVREKIVDVGGSATDTANVDPRTCNTTPGGSGSLCAVWRDPDFDPDADAVYYGRVIEEPTCRWSTRACNAAGIRCDEPTTVRRGWRDCCNPTFPKLTRERAWTSPVWYSP